MTTFYLKKGDRLPKLRATLLDGDGAAINLTGAAVQFRMRPRGGGALKVDAAATIVTPASGIVEYSWAALDVDTEGVFDAEFAVTLAGLVQTVPASGAVLVVIEPVLG
ncbi:MAG: hypothetical protein AAB721_02855 [Patescibacteria group bacterium]